LFSSVCKPRSLGIVPSQVTAKAIVYASFRGIEKPRDIP
jgi:hypothetical protein